MTKSLLDDAFGHHVWATLTIIDACSALTPEQLLAVDLDPGLDVVRHRDEGDSHAPQAIRLAQALHHGTDHRSQICTALTSLGIEPPEIDAWAYGRHEGTAYIAEPSAG